MRTIVVAVALLTAAFAAAAQETTPPAPTTDTPPKIDASPDKLMELLAETEAAPEPSRRIEAHVGAIDVRAFGTRFRIGYLPFMMPWPGARLASTKEWPDAFTMLGVPIATSRAAFQRSRAMSSELKRIERLTKAKARIQVNAH